MAYTTPWEWISINRKLDYITDDYLKYTRNNWVLSRYRFSDAVYNSEVGSTTLADTADSLTAYNGGETETITSDMGSDIDGIKSTSSNCNWVYDDDDIWVPTGRTVNGSPSYRQSYGVTNSPDEDRINVLFKSVYGSDYIWMFVDVSSDQYADESWLTSIGDYTNYAVQDDHSGSPFPADDPYTGVGTFIGTCVVTEGPFASSGSFLCTGDIQSYPDKAMSWYQQTQTWSFKDAWVGVE